MLAGSYSTAPAALGPEPDYRSPAALFDLDLAPDEPAPFVLADLEPGLSELAVLELVPSDLELAWFDLELAGFALALAGLVSGLLDLELLELGAADLGSGWPDPDLVDLELEPADLGSGQFDLGAADLALGVARVDWCLVWLTECSPAGREIPVVPSVRRLAASRLGPLGT